MPTFFNSRVMTVSDVANSRLTQSAIIKAEKLNKRNAPEGLVNSFNCFGYYLVGYFYEFHVDAFGTLGFGRMDVSFEQCRACLQACEWVGLSSEKWDFNKAKKCLKMARKKSLSGDALMIHFVKEFRTW